MTTTGLGSSWLSSSSVRTRLEGMKGASQGHKTRPLSFPRSVRYCSAEYRPVNGPRKPGKRSGTTSRPKSSKSLVSPSQLSSNGFKCGCNCSMTSANKERPFSSSRAFRPTPIRRERPPARITPAGCFTVITAGSLPAQATVLHLSPRHCPLRTQAAAYAYVAPKSD